MHTDTVCEFSRAEIEEERQHIRESLRNKRSFTVRELVNVLEDLGVPKALATLESYANDAPENRRGPPSFLDGRNRRYLREKVITWALSRRQS